MPYTYNYTIAEWEWEEEEVVVTTYVRVSYPGSSSENPPPESPVYSEHAHSDSGDTQASNQASQGQLATSSYGQYQATPSQPATVEAYWETDPGVRYSTDGNYAYRSVISPGGQAWCSIHPAHEAAKSTPYETQIWYRWTPSTAPGSTHRSCRSVSDFCQRPHHGQKG